MNARKLDFARLLVAATLAVVLPSAHAVDLTPPPIKLPSEPIGTRLPGVPTFNAGSAFADALQTGKTGVYVLGTTAQSGRIATTYGLVRDGRILDVASKSGTTWLAKRTGSTGGLGLSGAKFDHLNAAERGRAAVGAARGAGAVRGGARLRADRLRRLIQLRRDQHVPLPLRIQRAGRVLGLQ